MLSGGWEFHSNIHCTVEEKDHILVVHPFDKASSSFVAKSNATFRVRVHDICTDVSGTDYLFSDNVARYSFRKRHQKSCEFKQLRFSESNVSV